MSQTYQVELKEKMAQTVNVGKEWRKRVQLLSLLPESQMGEILAEELLKNGWSKEEDSNKLKQSKDGFDLEFDPVTRQLGIRYEEEEEVQVSANETQRVYDYYDREDVARERAEEALKSRLKGELKEAAETKEEEMLQDLERREAEILKLVDEAMSESIEKTHKEALKRKAGSLGEIESIEENDELGEVTIRVRL